MEDANELTPKQQRFVQEYLIDLNASAAAERAGFSAHMAKSIGWELLRKPHVAAAIEKEIAAREKRTRVTADRVLEQIARIAFFDPRKMFASDGSLRPIDTLGDDEAAAIASFEATETAAGVVVRKVRLADKLRALELIGRHLGLLQDKLTLRSDPENPISALIASIQGNTLQPVVKEREGE